MKLNEIADNPGSKHAKKRVGRGIGSGLGKTSGKGHKGQHARAGGYHKVGFEGGQMPLQRRLPKMGFRSQTRSLTAQLRLDELVKVKGEHAEIDMLVLKMSNLVPATCERVKVIKAGELKQAVTLKGIAVTKGARAAIEAAGGKVLES
jgi:large subunit ribosomal protein L15